MKERIFALLQRIERSFMLSIAVLPVTRSVLGLAIAFANETMITSYNLSFIFAAGMALGMAKRERAVTVLSSVIAFFVMYALINVLLVINGQILADNSIVIMF